jgi:hypothetical protein
MLINTNLMKEGTSRYIDYITNMSQPRRAQGAPLSWQGQIQILYGKGGMVDSYI